MVRNLISALIFSCLSVASANTQAAAAATVAAADAGIVKTATFAGELAVIDKAVFQPGQVIDLGGANIFWVLGGGLVALSLVARRISS